MYYYDKDFWLEFFKNLGVKTVISDVSNKQILDNGTNLANSEACLSLKLYLGHIVNLKGKCDYVLVPRLFSINRHEQVCTNFNALYDLVNNLFDIKIINYNIDLTTHNYKLPEFIKIGKSLGFSYKETYKAYRDAENISLLKRNKEEIKQQYNLNNENLKILIAGHPYNLYDDLIGKVVTNFLEKSGITIIYSNKINHLIINSECAKISTDIHFTHNKEVMASINYYKDKVDGIILISSFPCGPDSLANELVSRKVKNIPVISLIFEDLNSEAGVITRLESFVDIIKNLKESIHE